MNEIEKRALLPVGLRDVLPPDAAAEAALAEDAARRLRGAGLRAGQAAPRRVRGRPAERRRRRPRDQTFRLMDPASHRMMAVRSDLTPQVARIAVSRLSRSPRPLRLSYAGEVLRVRGGELRPERQFGQVGFRADRDSAAPRAMRRSSCSPPKRSTVSGSRAAFRRPQRADPGRIAARRCRAGRTPRRPAPPSP